MICLGFWGDEKINYVNEYCAFQEVSKVWIICPSRYALSWETVNIENPAEIVPYETITQYSVFYKLLQQIDNKSLLVIDECLRTQNRYDLSYNCIRNFLNQTNHSFLFQYLPIIESEKDFMILFDFDTKSRWKRHDFDVDLITGECNILAKKKRVCLDKIRVSISEGTKQKYCRQKRKLFDNIGHKDPHTIPRNLYLIGGGDKLNIMDSSRPYIGRNNRFSKKNMRTFKDIDSKGDYTVFELPHNFIDFTDFLAISQQEIIPVMVAELPVDSWYFNRYNHWANNLSDVYSKISGQNSC